MKLIIPGLNDRFYEILDSKKFEENLKNDDVKTFYQELYNHVALSNVLDEMVKNGLLITVGVPEPIEDLRYTLEYFKKLLYKKLSDTEADTFIKWCEDDFESKLIGK